jgi:hypothetical protein
MTTTVPHKVVGTICADQHARIVYYSHGDCPLCAALTTVALLEDKMLTVEFTNQTLRESASE